MKRNNPRNSNFRKNYAVFIAKIITSQYHISYSLLKVSNSFFRLAYCFSAKRLNFPVAVYLGEAMWLVDEKKAEELCGTSK